MPTQHELADLIGQTHADLPRRMAAHQPPTPAALTPPQLAAFIDHTLLKPDASETQIRTLCGEARQYGFASVCVNPTWVPLCAELLPGSGVKVCTVIGFPLGATLAEVKAYEAEAAIRQGAQEVDMVLNIGRLKSSQFVEVYEEIAAVVAVAHRQSSLVKVIIETALLSEDEKVAACVLAQQAGADFVKTSTGFSGGGATTGDVQRMRLVVGPQMGVKASGGVRTAADAVAMVAAGATRIGASAGVQIVQEATAGATRHADGSADGPASGTTTVATKEAY
jgi:deoxyribose-phosphate aldolase